MIKFIPFGILTCTALFLLWSIIVIQAPHNNKNSIVGIWTVDVVGAPYVPHLFAFNKDGTMLTTNPTNVQENSNKLHGGTNDSLGMGLWQKNKKDFFSGTFYELNAYADNHIPANTLKVSYKIKLNGDTFDGIALASFNGNSSRVTLHGVRLNIDDCAIKNISI